MNFINEQDGPPLTQSEFILSLFDHLTDFVCRCAGRGQLDKSGSAILFTGAGNDVSKGGLKHMMH